MKQVLIRRGLPIVVDVPAPQVADNSLLIEVAFSLISTGTEMAGLSTGGKSLLRQALEEPAKVVRGLQMIRQTGVRRTMALVNGELEAAYPTGYSCSGVVRACGRGTSGFAPGDRVACAGAGKANHAELVVIPQNLVVRVPDNCELESAASATVGAIALQGVRRADVRLGETVAVIGLGLIGQITIQLLKASGCRSIGTDVDSARVELAMSLGMTRGLESSDAGSGMVVLNLTDGRGVDAVIITASSNSPGIIQQAMQMVRKKGKVIVVGAVPLEMERSPFYEKEADLLISCSYGPGRYDPEYEERGRDYPYAYVRWTENRNMAEYLRLVADGTIRFHELIGKTWPIAEAPAAYADLKSSRHIAVLLSTNAGDHSANPEATTVLKKPPGSANGTLRTAVVGAGNFARAVHLPNLKRLNDRFSITAVAARTGAQALNIAQQYGAASATTASGEVFQNPDVDLVVISSRHDSHASLATQAAEHGKSVLLEKPAALTKAELTTLLNAFRKSGKMLAVGFNRRFAPLIREASALIERRAGPLCITYRMNAGYIPLDSWVQGPEGGGRIIGEACHIFDLFNFLVGTFPEEVTALALRPGAAHIAVTDNFTATVRYTDGSLCTLTYTSLGSSELPKESMEVFFDGKSMVLEDYRKLSFYGFSKKALSSLQQEKGHLEELQAVGDYLLGTGKLPMTLEEIESATSLSFLVDELVRGGTCAES